MYKKKGFMIGISILAILIVIWTWMAVSTGLINPLEHQLSLGYKCLEQGKYEEAILAFNKAIEIDNKKVDAYLGKAQAEIKLGNNDDALDTIENAIKIAVETEQTYSIENFRNVVEWWIENADPSEKSFDEIIEKLAEIYPEIIDSYKWGEPVYEEEEPYREYQSLILNGKSTNQKRYTGRVKPRFDKYTQYFDKNIGDVKKKFSNLKFLTGWIGSYWYKIDENRMLGFNPANSDEICIGAMVPLLDIYPVLGDVANQNGNITKKDFEEHINQKTEFVPITDGNEFASEMLTYQYNGLYIYVECDESGTIDIKNSTCVFWKVN